MMDLKCRYSVRAVVTCSHCDNEFDSSVKRTKAGTALNQTLLAALMYKGQTGLKIPFECPHCKAVGRITLLERL